MERQAQAWLCLLINSDKHMHVEVFSEPHPTLPFTTVCATLHVFYGPNFSAARKDAIQYAQASVARDWGPLWLLGLLRAFLEQPYPGPETVQTNTRDGAPSSA